MLYRSLVFSWMLATWLVFSGQFDFFHLTLGVLSALFVTWISADLLFDDRTSDFETRLRQGGRLSFYLIWLLWQVVLANIHLLALAFGPRNQIQPSIVRCRTNLKSDFEKFLLANSITLTPGTITVKIIGDEVYVHSISQKTAEGLNDGEMEKRIAAISEPAGKGGSSAA